MEAIEIITEYEAAAILRISAKTLSRMRKAGRVPYLPGKPVRYVKHTLLEDVMAKQVGGSRNAPQDALRTTIRKTTARSLSDKRALKAMLLS